MEINGIEEAIKSSKAKGPQTECLENNKVKHKQKFKREHNKITKPDDNINVWEYRESRWRNKSHREIKISSKWEEEWDVRTDTRGF